MTDHAGVAARGALIAAVVLIASCAAPATRAPQAFHVRLDTTKGAIVLELQRAWAPHGVDRFHELVRAGYYDDTAIFRIRAGVFAQFGIAGDPAVEGWLGAHWWLQWVITGLFAALLALLLYRRRPPVPAPMPVKSVGESVAFEFVSVKPTTPPAEPPHASVQTA